MKNKKIHIPGIWIAVVILYVVAVILCPNMLNLVQIRNLLKVSAFLGIVALGQTFVILAGGIDLSVASVITASNIICCMQMSYGNTNSFSAFALPLLLAIVLGAIRGLIIAKLNILPMIVSLSMNYILFGAALLLTNGVTKGRVSPEFAAFGEGGLVGGIPNTFVIFVIVTIILLFVQNRTRFGRELYATGANIVAAHHNGINTDATIIKAHIICSIAAAIAGILLSAYIELPSFDLGDPYSTNSIAACVVGGTLMTGGIGGIAGSFGGAIFMTILNSLLNVMKMSVGMQYAVRGAIILLGILASTAAKSTWNLKQLLIRLKQKDQLPTRDN